MIKQFKKYRDLISSKNIHAIKILPLLLLFFCSTAEAVSVSGVYKISEKFTDGATLTGQITYDAASDSITAAALRLSDANGLTELSAPYNAYQTNKGFAQKIINFQPYGAVYVTLVLNTQDAIPQFDLSSNEEASNNYGDMATLNPKAAEISITPIASLNQISLISVDQASAIAQLPETLSLSARNSRNQ